MILEIGRVVAVEPQGLWVETIQRSACGSCQAHKGCGHSLLAKFGASSASRLWVLLEGDDTNQYCVGDKVQIGISEDLITQSALFIYLMPLLSMLGATVLAHHQALTEGVSVIWALGGLILGAFIVRWHSHQTRFDSRLQPVVVGDQQTLQILESAI